MADKRIGIRWYGLNALEINCGGVAFFIDPYVSRNRELVHVAGEVEKYLPTEPKYIFMTHAHWDHLGDTPEVIARNHAVLFASPTACNIMRHFGVPDEALCEIAPGDKRVFGEVKVTVFESRHMEPVKLGFYDTVPDKIDGAGDWKCGEVFAFLIECDGVRIFNVGSANLYLPAVDGLACDYFICGVSRWKPGFPELISHIRYKKLIPTHHDEYTKPLSQFRLRDDFERLRAALPQLPGMELEVMKWYELPPLR